MKCEAYTETRTGDGVFVLPCVVLPEVLPPSLDIGTFLQHLVALHMDAKKIDWGDDHLARINASALCAMLAEEIERG